MASGVQVSLSRLAPDRWQSGRHGWFGDGRDGQIRTYIRLIGPVRNHPLQPFSSASSVTLIDAVPIHRVPQQSHAESASCIADVHLRSSHSVSTLTLNDYPQLSTLIKPSCLFHDSSYPLSGSSTASTRGRECTANTVQPQPLLHHTFNIHSITVAWHKQAPIRNDQTFWIASNEATKLVHAQLDSE
jgi:hypothetical protein